jgi:hypothetical protein
MGRLGRFARVVVLAGLAGALTAGKVPPEGIPCGLPDDQPELVFGFYVTQLGGAFPLDEDTCAKLTDGAIAACHKAVADSAACLGRVVDNLLKGMKTVCSTTGDPKACVDGAKAQNQGYEMEIDASEQDGKAVCDDEFADAIFDDCIGVMGPASGS